MKLKKIAIILALMSFVIGFNTILNAFAKEGDKKRFHTEKEREQLQLMQVMEPIADGEYFLHSQNCRTCHGFDSTHYANVDAAGVSVNVFDDWESSMMANSAKDPLWRAKVSHEILINPAHANELQDKCTSCHAPMGHYTSFYKGNPHYTIADLELDSLGLNGVSCVGCHAIGPDGLGSMFSGQIPYDTNRVLYGPYTDPNMGPMQLYVGMTPSYAPHMSESKVCSSCHTLLTNTADLAGNLTGGKFIEQATYHEYLNSSSASDNVTCQNCHMPRVDDSVRIANQYLNLPPRSPFNRHKFMGGNEFMVKLIKNNKAALGISVSDKNFDSTIAVTTRNLKLNTLNVDLLLDSVTQDSAFVRFKLTNKAGHKFPSGYPSRRAVVQVVAIDANQDTIFKSGLFTPEYALQNAPPSHQPHYTVINDETQTQVYEMVMGDVNGDKTTVLERAAITLKDNRLPPEGFVTTHPVYDTVKIVGEAETDPNFNKYNGGIEGSGQDYVHYHIALSNVTTSFKILAKVYYQTVPPEWLQEMFAISSQPINDFKAMYNAADKTPVLVGSDSLVNLAIGLVGQSKELDFKVSPTVTSDGWVTINGAEVNKIQLIQVYNVAGQMLMNFRPQQSEHNLLLHLPDTKGVYFISIMLDDRKTALKVVRQ